MSFVGSVWGALVAGMVGSWLVHRRLWSGEAVKYSSSVRCLVCLEGSVCIVSSGKWAARGSCAGSDSRSGDAWRAEDLAGGGVYAEGRSGIGGVGSAGGGVEASVGSAGVGTMSWVAMIGTINA